MHKQNCFVTLTFDDKHVPKNGSVNLRDLQLFFKKLRKFHYGKKSRASKSSSRPAPLDAGSAGLKLVPHTGAVVSAPLSKLRFFACGEYGGPTHRPHYHALIFGFQFPDLKFFKSINQNKLYTSPTLQKLWPYGFSTIGTVNFTTASYVAQYIIKKINGNLADEHYTRPHCVTGELMRHLPEFVTMSKKPGLGTSWYDQFKSDCYPSDFLVVDGHKVPIPKFYDKKLKIEAEQALEKLKRRRKAKSLIHRSDGTPERLAVREEKATLDINSKKRVLGDYTLDEKK